MYLSMKQQIFNMKAIKLQAKLKEQNLKLFKENEVGELFQFNPPNKIVVDKFVILGYDKRTDLHNLHRIKDVTQPKNVDYNTQKLGELIEVDEIYTYEVIELSEKELNNRIPKEVPKLYFKLELDKLGITDADISTLIDTLPESMNPNRIRLMWFENNVVERDNPYLFQLLPSLNQMKGLEVTEEQIINIFKTFGNA
jgi:hypothetical protein